jgi:pimeloyl-ACP methyl ester carboxylesterase
MTRRALLLAIGATLLSACKGKVMTQSKVHLHCFDGLGGNKPLRQLAFLAAAKFAGQLTVTTCAWDHNAWPHIIEHAPDEIIWLGFSLGGASALREAKKKDSRARAIILLDPVPQSFGERWWGDYRFEIPEKLPGWCLARTSRNWPRSKLANKNNEYFNVPHGDFCGDAGVRAHVLGVLGTLLKASGAAQSATPTPAPTPVTIGGQTNV